MRDEASRGWQGVARDVAVSLVFLTRIPPERLGLDPSAAPELRGAVRVFPLAGALIGLAGGIVLLIGHALALPPLAAALVATAAVTILTGALHEDGLADTADGFGGGRTIEARLAIMRDSRIGSYGALALVFAVLLKASLLAAFLPLAPFSAAAAFVAAEALGRAAIVHHWADLPPARPDGLAAGIGQPDRETVAVSLVLAIAVGLVAGTIAAGPVAALVALAAAALATLGFNRLADRMVGGHTGDTLGAAEQCAALAALLALVAFA